MQLFYKIIWTILCLNSVFVHGKDIQNTKIIEDELVFAQTICRHGDRNSYKSLIRGDEWSSEKFWPGGYGELTNIGKQQHYALGEYLRVRYAKLIGDGEYSPRKVYVKATDIDRVLMGAQVTLAGLFPPNIQQKWNANLNWQPIPVHTEPRNQDYMISPERPCDRYDLEMFQFINTSEYKSLFTERKSAISSLEENSGLKLRSLLNFNYFFDKLYLEQLKGYRLPMWAEEALESGDLKYLATYFYRIFTHTTEMKKLRSGFLLKEILDRFKEKSQSLLSPDRTMWMYFAHDTTIANVLNSLGLFELHRPPYASCLFFELHKIDTANYVQVFYRNSTESHIPAMEIPNCGSKCPLNKWYEQYKDILPTRSYEEECQLNNDDVLPSYPNPEFKPIDIL